MTSETNEFRLICVVWSLEGKPLYVGYTSQTNLDGWALSRKQYNTAIDGTCTVSVWSVVPFEEAPAHVKAVKKMLGLA